jgi:peptidyl-tRNA hydrolase, PTH1 family
MKYLLVGLGNPGREYAYTRHNIGFLTLDRLAAEVTFRTERYGEVAEVSFRGRKLVLLKPSTFMNMSGDAVRYHLERQKVEQDNLLIITDDLALPLGTLRLRPQGSAGGHNGLKHIEATLGTSAYQRLRLGVGNAFAAGRQVDYVLSDFAPEEQQHLTLTLGKAAEACQSFSFRGLAQTMASFNKHFPLPDLPPAAGSAPKGHTSAESSL